MVAAPVAKHPIEVVSPSMLNRLACPARVAFGQRTNAGGSDSHAATVGTAIHEAMEAVVKAGEQPEDAWERKVERPLAAASSDDLQLRVKRARKRFLKRAPELVGMLSRYPESQPCKSEVELTSACGTIRGTPDLVWFTDGGAIVVDYKSGVVQFGSDVSPNYSQQLQLYAALASESYGVDVVAGWLFSLRQGAVEVDVSRHRRDAVLERARTTRLDFNSRGQAPQPFEPDDENCRYCSHQARCPGFWAAQLTGEVSEAGRHPVRGVAARPAEKAGDLSAISLQQPNGEVFRVCRIPGARLGETVIGSPVSLTGLGREERGEEVWFEWRQRSQIHLPE